MRDRRSKTCEVARDAIEYVWNPEADTGPDSPAGAYVDKRDAWIGADGKLYHEETKPSRSVPGTLGAWVAFVAEEREISPGTGDVTDLCGWLDRHLDWITRREWVDALNDDLRELRAQLIRGRHDWRPIGDCPVLTDTGTCKATLRASLDVGTVRCWVCGAEWARDEWLHLGSVLATV